MILDKILKHKYAEVEENRNVKSLDELKRDAGSVHAPAKSFHKAISSGDRIGIIAEIKKASPSKGVIREDFNPVALAKECERAGACALSVLTDEKYFQGSLNYLADISKAVSIPILRKDFIIDEYQIYEARVYGASAVLLLANVLEDAKLKEFLELSHSLGMDCLVEVHSKEELDRVLHISPKIIGINNRDLRTFNVDLKTIEGLIPYIDREKVVVSESGVFTREDMKYLEGLGVSAVLIGEGIMKAHSVGNKIKELLYDND